MRIDIEQLLAPISPDAKTDSPTGRNIRADAVASADYYAIKDARSAARLLERQADAEVERGATPGEWRTVHDLATQILATTSKDIEVSVWLIEAAIRLDGFAGLRAALAVLDGLVDRYWSDLHALDEEDLSMKVASIAGLNGAGAEGSLIQPIRLAALTEPTEGDPASLWHYMVMRRRGPAVAEATRLASAVRATPVPRLVEIYQDIAEAHRSYGALTLRLDTLCGDDAPPSSAIRSVLEEAMDAMRDVARDALASIELEADRPPVPAPQPVASPAAPEQQQQAAPMQAPVLRTREDALRELSRIAAFFQEYEPNSPTALTLETVIRRARLPLMELLAELIPEEASRRTYLDIAGIRPVAGSTLP